MISIGIIYLRNFILIHQEVQSTLNLNSGVCHHFNRLISELVKFSFKGNPVFIIPTFCDYHSFYYAAFVYSIYDLQIKNLLFTVLVYPSNVTCRISFYLIFT